MTFITTKPFTRAIYDRDFPTLMFDLENVEIASPSGERHLLRLMVAKAFFDVEEIVVARPFIDYHDPIKSDRIDRRCDIYVPSVALEVVRVDDGGVKSALQPAPFIQLDEFDSYAAYVRDWLQDSRFKDDARRRRQAEKALGPLVFTVHDPDAIEQAFEWKREQYPGNKDLSREGCAFLVGLRNHLTVSTLRANGVLLAAWVGYIHEGMWGGWIFSVNPGAEFKKYSFGRQLLYSMIEEAFARKLRQFDFSIGGEDYKWYFATHARLCGPIGRPTLRHKVRSWTRKAARALATP